MTSNQQSRWCEGGTHSPGRTLPERSEGPLGGRGRRRVLCRFCTTTKVMAGQYPLSRPAQACREGKDRGGMFTGGARVRGEPRGMPILLPPPLEGVGLNDFNEKCHAHYSRQGWLV